MKFKIFLQAEIFLFIYSVILAILNIIDIIINIIAETINIKNIKTIDIYFKIDYFFIVY